VYLALLIIFLTIAQAEEGIGHVEPVKVVAEEIGYGFIGGVSAISSVPTRYRVSALAVLVVWDRARAPADSCTSPTLLMGRLTAGNGCRGFAIRQVSPADAVLTRFG